MSRDIESAGVDPNTAAVDAEISGVGAAAETAGVSVENAAASDCAEENAAEIFSVSVDEPKDYERSK